MSWTKQLGYSGPGVMFLFLTAAVIVCASAAIQKWPAPWNYFFFASVYLLLGASVLIARLHDNLPKISIPGVLYAITVLGLAVLNVLSSKTRLGSIKSAVLFFVTGPLIWWVARKLSSYPGLKKSFFAFLTLFLVPLCVYGLIELWLCKRLYLFNNNSIAAGSVVLLSLSGPFWLYSETVGRMRWFLAAIFAAGMILLVLTGKRGALLGGIGMILALALLLWDRRSFFIIAGLTLLILTGYLQRNRLPSDLQRHFLNSESSRQRAENYYYAVHLFKQKPLIGHGWQAPIHEYLNQYRERFPDKNYSQYIYELRGLDNIILTGIVMGGSLLTLLYSGLIAFSLWQYARSGTRWSRTSLLPLLPLFGFFIQSLTYDSLLFPQVNWLFHAVLGVLSSGGHPERVQA